jgi:phosphoglycolate phosphatase-like HAD superfamily hydrolase
VPRFLALDFDGVISNSAPEAFVVALRTWVAMKPAPPLHRATAGFLEGAAPTVDAVVGHPLYRSFVDLMPLGNRAEDYSVALVSIAAGRVLPDQSAYDEFRAGIDAKWLREYHARFYRERASLSRADLAGWLALMSPYEPFLRILRSRAGDVTLCIATAKDRGSVRKLLRAYGVDDLFPEARVLDKEAGITKSDHLRHLRELFGCRFDEMYFVDDKVNHLDDVAHLGVHCALAGWGFNGPREAALARAAGHLVCSLDDAEAKLFG